MTQSTRYPTASAAQPDSSTAAGDDPTDAEGPVVLLHVEPDAESAELLAAFVERFADGVTARAVDGMAAALDALDAGAADRLVTEQRLPDGSGVELVERLRARGSDLPVAFHTTCCEAATEARALDAGADAYFAKQPDRGQYECLLDWLRGLGGDVDSDARATTARSSTGTGAVAEPTDSEE